METDKATVEMEAYTNGTIRKLIASEGQFVKVGGLIGIIGGADVPMPYAKNHEHKAMPSPSRVVAAVREVL